MNITYTSRILYVTLMLCCVLTLFNKRCGVLKIKLMGLVTPTRQESTCRVPDQGPFDVQVLKYVRREPQLDCGNPQPMKLTRRSFSGRLMIDMKRVRAAGFKNLTCNYSEVMRVPSHDYFTLHGNQVML